MPLDEIESHPYLNYHKQISKSNDFYTGIIIGTFPIYYITQNIDNSILRFDESKANFNFFYGSIENRFWCLLCQVFNIQDNLNPLKSNIESTKKRVELATNVLISNNLLITDVIKTTNRFNTKTKDSFCSMDSSLLNRSANKKIIDKFSLNIDLINLLNDNLSIKYLFFSATGDNSNTPFGLFKKIVGNRLKMVQCYKIDKRLFAWDISINNRPFIAFFLPSPAGEGYRGIQLGDSRQLKMFTNFLEREDPILYNALKRIKKDQRTSEQKENLTKLRDMFILETWKQALINQNKNFQG